MKHYFVKVKCSPFSGQRKGRFVFRVEIPGNEVKVYDPVAEHYVPLHNASGVGPRLRAFVVGRAKRDQNTVDPT